MQARTWPPTAAVVVEHHFDCIGANSRLLSRRFAFSTEWSRRHDPRCNGKAKTMPKDDKQEGCKGDENWHRRSAELLKKANRSLTVRRGAVVSQSLSTLARLDSFVIC